MNRCDTSSRRRYSLRVRRRRLRARLAVAPGPRARRRNRVVAKTPYRHRPASGTPLPAVATVRRIGSPPLVLSGRLQRQIRLDGRDQPVGAFAVRLVHDEDVGDFHDAGLERLHVVAGAGHERDDRDVGRADDVDLVLTDAHRLDDDDVLAGRVEHERGVAGRARQAAQMPARRHAADEDRLRPTHAPACARDRRAPRRR